MLWEEGLLSNQDDSNAFGMIPKVIEDKDLARVPGAKSC